MLEGTLPPHATALAWQVQPHCLISMVLAAAEQYSAAAAHYNTSTHDMDHYRTVECHLGRRVASMYLFIAFNALGSGSAGAVRSAVLNIVHACQVASNLQAARGMIKSRHVTTRCPHVTYLTTHCITPSVPHSTHRRSELHHTSPVARGVRHAAHLHRKACITLRSPPPQPSSTLQDPDTSVAVAAERSLAAFTAHSPPRLLLVTSQSAPSGQLLRQLAADSSATLRLRACAAVLGMAAGCMDEAPAFLHDSGQPSRCGFHPSVMHARLPLATTYPRLTAASLSSSTAPWEGVTFLERYPRHCVSPHRCGAPYARRNMLCARLATPGEGGQATDCFIPLLR
jgi:hypothetical protein